MKNLKKKFFRFFKNFWPYLLIIAVVCVFFWKVFIKSLIPFPGDFVVGIYYPWLDYKWGYSTGVPVKNPIIADVPSFIYPMQTYAVELMKKGQWPLWNRLILGGVPLLANFQSAPFTPLIFLYFLFDKITAWSMQIIFAHILAAVFTYLLLKQWGVSKLGGVTGGLIFAFSGYNLIWSQWNGHVLAAAFIPLILFFQDRWLKRGKIMDGVGVSFAFCFQLFSGYPQTVTYTAVAVALLWLFRIFEYKRIVVRTLLLLLFFSLGMGVAATQLLTGKELLSLSQWMSEPHPYEWAFLPWQKVITFFAPDFFGNHVTQNYWGPQDYTSNTGFVGIVAFVLASLGIILIRKRREILYLVTLCVTTLLISFPTVFSIFLWQHNILGMRSSSAHRALVLFNLGVALMVGFGFDLLLKSKINIKNIIKVLFIPGLLIAGFTLYSLILYYLSSYNPQVLDPVLQGIPKYMVGLRNMVLPLGILAATSLLLFLVRSGSRFNKIAVYLLAILMIFEIYRFGWKFTPFSPKSFVYPDTPVLEFLNSQQKPFRVAGSSVIPVNLIMPYKIEYLEGYETMRPLLISRFIAVLNTSNSKANPAGRYGIIDNYTSPLLDLTNTKYYLTHKLNEKEDLDPDGTIPLKFDTSRFSVVFEDRSVAVLESKTALPRAFMVYDWEVIGDDEKILDRLLDNDFPYFKKIILDKEPSVNKPVSEKHKKADVNYRLYGEQESVIEVTTDSDGLLFISDSYYPGWKAYIDNNETEILRADFAFRAVNVTKGVHEVRFKYQPASFWNGLIISALSFLLLSLLWIIIKLLGKKGG